MTKRKTPQKPNAAINSTPPKQAVGSDKVESNTVAAPKPKRANNKAPAKPRGRPKKALVERVGDDLVYTEDGKQLLDEALTTVNKVIDADSRTITYWEEQEVTPTPSLYSRFKAWLVFKLYHYTSFFRTY